VRNLSLLLSVLFLLLPEAHAQELLGQLRGTVYDQGGIAVPGAVVNITSPQLMGGRTADTDADGTYRFSALPPGSYRVEAQMAGMRPASVDVRVVAGQTSRADLTLVVETAGEAIVVEQSAPTVDTTAVKSGVTLTREMLRDIPSRRDYQGAMELAPGVVDDGSGNPNMRGGLGNANQYFVDGVNTTDPVTNTFSMNMNYDAIEEINVITGGMDAEYGRALGGIVNIVTRSGGNEFHGDVQLLYSSTETQIYKPLEGEDKDSQQNATQSIAANLGGPIIKDKLWFFAGAEFDRFLSTLNVTEDVGRPLDQEGFEVDPYTFLSAYLFGKLTWQPVQTHRLTLHFQADPTDISNTELNPYTLPSGETDQLQGGWIASLSHVWTPSDHTVLNSHLYAQNGYLYFMPNAWRDCQNVGDNHECLDDIEDGWFASDADGFNANSHPYAYLTKRNRYSLNLALTEYFDAAGKHQAKIGVQGEYLTDWEKWPGFEDGIPYYSWTTSPTDIDTYQPDYIIKYVSDLEARMDGTLISAFLQDVWQPIPRLTLRPGIRMDTSSLTNDAGEVVFDAVVFAGRGGVAYDLTDDGRTPIHAYYGRFYDMGFLELSGILLSQSQASNYYAWDPVAGAYQTTPFFSTSSEFLSHDDLQAPYSDEFDVGIHRDLGDGWAAGITGTYRKTHNMWEDDDVNLIWNEDGTQVIGARNGDPTTAIYRLRTPDEAWLEYKSVELTADRQFDEHWGLLSSYTWSRTYGFFQGNNESIAGPSFDIPPEYEDEIGLAPYNTTHQLKVSGAYRNAEAWALGSGDTALGFLFGWNFLAYSGYPVGRYEWNYLYGDYNNLTDSVDDSWELPVYSRTDLKAGLTLAHGPSKRIDLTIECFNVFNTRSVTSADWSYSDETGEPAVNSDGGLIWNTPLSRQSPRDFQIGLRGEL
jgi:outer membrane receptor for ferrienterochelin and colicin